MSDKGKSETAKREEEVIAFWKEDKTFEKSLQKHAPKGEFIFYDGPPFATGLPHHGSLLSSIIKDVVPRYKTMRGYRVPRRWGWDCHGLPIESLIEKRLNLKTKKDILDIGIDTFNEAARASVMEYEHEWEKYVDRIGRWVDFKNSYKTMDNSYIESVWWALKQLNNKKLLYEGKKVLMYCPHCETPLAKAEIAMDNTYKDITEEAVTAKFKVKHPEKYGLPNNSYLLAWTTTPWTLPGNVALAVGKDIEYAAVEENGEYLISATPGGMYFGKDLVGIEYEPLFNVPALHSNKSYKVYAADFVTTEDGTGIVHTAVMYGEDDFALGQKEGLPQVQLLTANGHYNDRTPEFIRGEYIKKAEKIIKAKLEESGLLFKREMHTHSYPHCYRCGTALIYNAVASWFINIQKVKSRMLKLNELITWVPAHLKRGRFKHILDNAPDWTISRNRFWASPMPIWKEKGGTRVMVVGSLEDVLTKVKRSGNKYFVMRHGEAKFNVKGMDDMHGDPTNHLTEKGKRDALHTAALELKKQKIDIIITSPFLRTRETAAIVQKELELRDSAVMVDERLREASESSEVEVRRRVGEFIFEVERRYTGKHVLIISHGNPLWVLQQTAVRDSSEGFSTEYMLRTAEVKEMSFVPFPHNKNYELDLHRPYIDMMVLVDEKGRHYERIPEVLDCWVESGAMPFASVGYPKNKELINPERFFGLWPKGYPADFIAEYIAQTRTWFYYMHAIGVLLFKKHSFRAVVSTGTILASDGSKMSKSKGNYTDPLLVMDQFGADALRLYLMGSVVMNGEDFNFKDEEVRESHNRVVGILWNSYKFFELYKGEYDGNTKAAASPHVLDRWVLALLGQTIDTVTKAMDAYDTPIAVRTLRTFIEDYSTWYVRRSRDRVKGDDESDKQFALATQKHVLGTVTKLLAPITPFIAESVYQGVEGERESVHLAAWPAAHAVDAALLANMQTIRELASFGLQAREQAGIKVRQPLARLKAKSIPQDVALLAVLGEELNVKEIVEDATLETAVVLDTELTAELREEGTLRTLIRRVQEWRKEQGLTIADRPSYTLAVSAEEKAVAQKYKDQIVKETNLNDLTIAE